MKTPLYITAYLISNAFRTFCIYVFLDTFFTIKKPIHKFFPFFVFFILVSLEYIFIDIPVVTMTLNVFGIFLLTYLYTASTRSKFLATVFAYALSAFSEVPMGILVNYFSFSIIEKGSYDSILGTLCAPLIQFIFNIIYSRMKQRSKSIVLPTYYLVGVLIPPVSSFIITIYFYSSVRIGKWQFLFVEVLLFTIIIGVFIMYEKQLDFFRREHDIKLIEAQNSYYQRQFEIIRESDESIQRVRHDMKNHLLAIDSLADKDKNSEIRDYIHKLHDEFASSGQIAHSDNPIIDGLINAKVAHASMRHISFDISLRLPEHLPIDDMDMTVLLGNLLDNAIENTTGTISLSVHYSSGRLIITCINPFDGERERDGIHYRTTKDEPELHGYGLKNMNRIVDKYEGILDYNDIDGVFNLQAILYL